MMGRGWRTAARLLVLVDATCFVRVSGCANKRRLTSMQVHYQLEPRFLLVVLLLHSSYTDLGRSAGCTC